MEYSATALTEYEQFVLGHSKGHFTQSIRWAKIKSNWKNELIVHRDRKGNIIGAMSILIRKVPFLKYTLMYSPRGPVCDIHDIETLSALIEKAAKLAQKYNSYVLKMDPDISSDDMEFKEMTDHLGIIVRSGSKNFEGIQPQYVFRLNIKDKSLDEILASFHTKTRYNIKLASKKGVEVKIGTREDLPSFHKLMIETGIRDKFVVRNLEYFEKMFDCLGEHMRLYMAFHNQDLISATIAILYGNKCWYLYGASSNHGRNYMPNYLLQWEMIKWAVDCGCDIYDFRGVSGDLNEKNPLYGLYRFKKGFNGDLVEFVGELEFVFNPFINFCVEKGEKIFRELRRRLFLIFKRS